MPRGKQQSNELIPAAEAEMLLNQLGALAKTKAEGGPGGHFRHVNTEWSDKTSTIILPEKMTRRQACHWLEEQDKQDEEPVDVLMKLDAYPVDGALALERALMGKYNMIQFKADHVQTMFGVQVVPPKILTIKTGVTTTATAHWGVVQVPGVDGYLKTDIAWNGRRLTFNITGQVKQKHQEEIRALEELVRNELKYNSIFRGKAIRVSFRDDDRGDDPTEGRYKFDPMRAPDFMLTSPDGYNNIVFDDDLQGSVDTHVYGPVMFTAAHRKNGLPLKKGILAAGPYGTGKTLIASAVAWLCEQNGWTYINVPDVRDLDCAFEMAKQYQPAVIFAEDLDRAVKGEDRTVEIDRILNTIDGVDSKNCEIITILTTNNLEDINSAMLRPGRIDCLLHVKPPTAKAALRLVKKYADGTLSDADDEEFIAALKPLSDRKANAAIYREVTKRAIAANVVRQCMTADARGEDTVCMASVIEPQDIATSVASMADHLDHMAPKPKSEKNAMRDMGIGAGIALADALATAGEDFRSHIPGFQKLQERADDLSLNAK